MKKVFFMLFVSLFLFSSLNAKGKEDWPKRLTFGIGHFGNQEKTKKAYTEIAKYLEKNLGIKIRIYQPSDASTVTKGIKFNNINISILGSKLYLKTKKEADIEVLVIENHKKTKTNTYAVLLANKDFKWQKKKVIYKVAVPSKLSTCFPCLKNYLKKKKAKSAYTFTGSGKKSIEMLRIGNSDFILVNNMFLSKFKNRNSFKILWKSKSFPTFPIVVSSKLPKSLKKSIKKLFLEYKNKNSLKLIGLSGFKSAKDKDFNGLRKLLKMELKANKKSEK